MLHHTTDGGQTWAVIPSTEPGQGVGPEAVTDLFFSPDQRGWVSISHGTSVMDPAWLLRATASGGQTWQTLATGHEYLTQLHFLSSQRGYATLGNSGALLTTADGGRTWQRIYGNPPVPHTLFFFDTLYGVGVGLAEDAARVLHTTDGGRQWQAGVSLAPACGAAGVLAVEALQFVDRLTGTLQVTCGNAGAAPDTGISLGTSDGGTTWQARPAPVRTIPAGSPTPLPSTVGWYVDLYSNLVPGAVPQLPPATASAWHLPITVYPDGQPWYAGTRDPRSPSSGALLRTRDAGATWQRYDLWTAPRSLAFVDAQHGWLQDWQRQHLYWTADGGAHWEQVR
jgi:photosystem II stability/assembly factor-like uncharacterized protein